MSPMDRSKDPHTISICALGIVLVLNILRGKTSVSCLEILPMYLSWNPSKITHTPC